jgi:hypothetical protein
LFSRSYYCLSTAYHFRNGYGVSRRKSLGPTCNT